MTQIFYFPRYSQRENFYTNNTLLLFHRLYNFNRLRFERFLAGLLRESVVDSGLSLESLGLQIVQQIGTGRSVVDGYLYQDSLRIVIETKRSGEAFDVNQLERHLSAFPDRTGGILVLLSPERISLEGSTWQPLKEDVVKRDVVLVSVSFENVIDSARKCLNDYDEEMRALVDDYEAFCSEEELLPTDKWTLFVPPCGQSHTFDIKYRVYACPASWRRRKSRYLGIYYDKAVRHIGVIAKRIECDFKDGNIAQDPQSDNLTQEELQRIVGHSARAMEEHGWDQETGHQFFLCDEFHATEFRKTSPGGIQGHRYFDLREYIADTTGITTAARVADGLNGAQWEMT